MLRVNEIFWSLQGEGARTGQATTFVRLAGCNLHCPFCDTDHERFVPMAEEAILAKIKELPPSRWVCLTGGEPLLQNVEPLLRLLKTQGYLIQIETNASIHRHGSQWLDLVDWLTISPKKEAATFEEYLRRADEIKLVVDGQRPCLNLPGLNPKAIKWLQPASCETLNFQIAIEIIKEEPEWRLSAQVHKLIRIK